MLAAGTARGTARSWLDLANRDESLRPDSVTGGRLCDWSDSSSLTVEKMFPKVGLRLLATAFRDWPIGLCPEDERLARASEPEVSLLIPIGGSDRLPQFKLCLAAARAQRGASVEIVVVEVSDEPTLASSLPEDVTYLHVVPLTPEAGFNKSRALNQAAATARGRFLVVLDADMLVPRDFCREVARVLEHVEVTRPARLLFNLDQAATQALVQSSKFESISGLEGIFANTPNPIAVRASTYREVGGHDESYAGWGGEDSEFLDRLRTRTVAEGGWLPILHAWHAPAPAKASGLRNAEHHREKMLIPSEERIRLLHEAGPAA
jgi:hypothetical protein